MDDSEKVAQIEAEENSFEQGQTASPKDTPPKKNNKKKKVLIILISLALIGGLVAVLLFVWPGYLKQNQTAVKVANTPSKKVEPKQDDPSLIYAYKEGKKTVISQLNLRNDTKKDVFSFEELNEFRGDDNFYAELDPAVDVSPDGKQYAYITRGGLQLRQVDSGAESQLIKATPKKTKFGQAYSYTPSIKTIAGPEDIFGLYTPDWSADSMYIGFVAGLYEGNVVDAINVKTKKLAAPGNAFRYAESVGLKNPLTLDLKNQPLQEAGVFPEYLVKQTELFSAIYTPDKDEFYAILCPKDKPNTGNSRYTPGAGFSGITTDCGEKEDHRVIKVTISDGSYKIITSGQFEASQVLGGDEKLYIALRQSAGHNVLVFDPSDSSSKQVDIVKTATLPQNSKIIQTRVFNTQTPIAGIYYKTGDKYNVAVVDIQKNKLLTRVELAKSSAFKPLLLH